MLFAKHVKQFVYHKIIQIYLQEAAELHSTDSEVKVDYDQEKTQSEIPTPENEKGKSKLTIRFLYYENIS